MKPAPHPHHHLAWLYTAFHHFVAPLNNPNWVTVYIAIAGIIGAFIRATYLIIQRMIKSSHGRQAELIVHRRAVHGAADGLKRKTGGGASQADTGWVDQCRAVTLQALKDKEFCHKYVTVNHRTAARKFFKWLELLQTGMSRDCLEQTWEFNIVYHEHLIEAFKSHPSLSEWGQDIRTLLQGLEAKPRGNLIRDKDEFIGRQEAIREIEERLMSEPLVALFGPGGVGKTRLVHELGERLKYDYRFQDGIFLVDVTTLESEHYIYQATARALDLLQIWSPQDLPTLTRFLQTKSLLLILDNCERLQSQCEAFAASLRSCQNVKILATTTKRTDEWHSPYVVHPLGTTDPKKDKDIALAQLKNFEAVQLLECRINEIQAGFHVSDENAPFVRQVCERLDGIPLALELAAARIGRNDPPLDAFVGSLNNILGVLNADKAIAAHHRTISALIDWSYGLLETDQRAVFRRASVFAGGWTEEAIRVVASSKTLPEADVIKQLRVLEDYSLVMTKQDGVKKRFYFLDTVRQFAARELSGRKEFRDRHRDYYLALAEEAEQKRTTADGKRWLDTVERELDNMRGALAYCRQDPADAAKEQEAEIGMRLATALWRFWEIRGYVSEARDHLRNALDHAAAAAFTPSRGRALRALGRIEQALGHMVTAQAALTDSVTICAHAGDRQGMAMAQVDLGWIVSIHGSLDEANDLYGRSLPILIELHREKDVASTRYNLGIVAYYRGDDVAAWDLLTQCRDGHRSLGNPTGLAVALIGLANVAMDRGESARARELLQESLDTYTSVNDVVGIATSHIYLGCWKYYANRDCLGAITDIQNGLTETEKAGWKDVARTEGLRVQALARRETQDLAGAKQAARQARDLSLEMGDRRQGAAVFEVWAQVLAAEGQAASAAKFLGAAEALRDAVKAPIRDRDRDQYDRTRAAVEADLGAAMFADALKAGAAQTWEEAAQAMASL